MFVAWWCLGGALAHNPHDPVSDLAVSPDPARGPQVWIVRTPAANWRLSELATSVDAGHTWSGVPRGLTEPHPLLGVALSPGFAADGTGLAWSDRTLWGSTDGATTWAPLYAAGAGESVRAAVAATGPSGAPRVFVSTTAGVSSSDDLGATWTQVFVPTQAFAVSPDHATDQTAWAAIGDRVSETADGGVHWVRLPERLPRVRTFGPAAGGELWVGTDDGLFHRTGPGAPLSPVPPFDGVPIDLVTPSPAHATDRTVWVATDRQGLYRSTDAGLTWARFEMIEVLSDQTQHHYHELGFSPDFATDGTMFLGAFEGLFVSTDRGETWTERDTRPPGLVNAVAPSPGFADDGGVVVATYDAGTYFSADRGDTFVAGTTGLVHSSVYGVAWTLGAEGPVLLAGMRDYFSRTPDRGTTPWTNVPYLHDDMYSTRVAASPAFAADDTVFAGTRTSGVFRSTDGGDTWENVLPHRYATASIAVSPAFATDGVVVVSTMGDGVWRTEDRGTTWAPVPFDPEWSLLAFDADPAAPTLFAGSAAGLWVSADRGASFAPVAALGPGPIEAVATAGRRTVFVSVRGGRLLRSDDRGATFRSVGRTLWDQGLQPDELAPSPDYDADHTLFASALDVVLRSVDGGETWTRISPDPLRYEESTQAVGFVGGRQDWDPAASCTGLAVFSAPGEETGLTFVGTGVRLIGATGPDGGPGTLWLDGVARVEFDTWAGTVHHQQVLAAVEGEPSGVHEARVTFGGEVVVDAFEVRTGELPPPSDTGHTADTGTPPTGSEPTGETDPEPEPDPRGTLVGGCRCDGSGGAGPGVLLLAALLGRRRVSARGSRP